MSDFGKKLRGQREQKGLSQSKLAEQVSLHHSIIGRYEREEAKPTIDVVIRLADALDTTVSYLLGENDNATLFKNQDMLKRFQDIASFPDEDQNHIMYTIDALIKNVKLRSLSQA
jgi:transcriptional regulator with XRE-family HTH domain